MRNLKEKILQKQVERLLRLHIIESHLEKIDGEENEIINPWNDEFVSSVLDDFSREIHCEINVEDILEEMRHALEQLNEQAEREGDDEEDRELAREDADNLEDEISDLEKKLEEKDFKTWYDTHDGYNHWQKVTGWLYDRLNELDEPLVRIGRDWYWGVIGNGACRHFTCIQVIAAKYMDNPLLEKQKGIASGMHETYQKLELQKLIPLADAALREGLITHSEHNLIVMDEHKHSQGSNILYLAANANYQVTGALLYVLEHNLLD